MSVTELDRMPTAAPAASPNGPDRALRRPASRIRRALRVAAESRWIRSLMLVALLAALIVPTFRLNILTTADPSTFQFWQADSEALVYGKIESTTPLAPPSDTDTMGLLIAEPNRFSPSDTLNAVATGGRPASAGYDLYPAQLGLQGFLFTALFHLGANSVSLLWTVNALLTGLAVIAFAFALARTTRRSLAAVFIAVAVTSPWLVEAARNLYWVPWTWFLPACVAAWGLRFRRPAARRTACAVLFLTFALRWGCGFEFISSFTLLTMSMPVLAVAFGRIGGGARAAIRHALTVLGIAVASFVVVLLVQSFVEGRGNFAEGLHQAVFDAAKRTYGGMPLDDPLLAASVAANPLKVLMAYFTAWPTPIVSLNLGAPLTFTLVSAGFCVLVLAAIGAVFARFLLGDRRWRRDAVVAVVALVVPTSWYVLAKGHSYIHMHIDFVLWYLIGVAALFWLVGALCSDLLGRPVAGAFWTRRVGALRGSTGVRLREDT